MPAQQPKRFTQLPVAGVRRRRAPLVRPSTALRAIENIRRAINFPFSIASALMIGCGAGVGAGGGATAGLGFGSSTLDRVSSASMLRNRRCI